MGYAEDEFTNVLRGPFSGENSNYRCEPVKANHWRISQPGEAFMLEIEISKMANRVLSPLVQLPVLKVRFNQQDSDEKLRGQFFERFHQYFHKGGG